MYEHFTQSPISGLQRIERRTDDGELIDVRYERDSNEMLEKPAVVDGNLDAEQHLLAGLWPRLAWMAVGIAIGLASALS